LIEKDGKNIIISAAPDKVIFADLKNKQACKDYANCISGTFQYTGKVCSILIANGRVINNSSAHAWLGYPDSCLIYYKDGAFAVKRLLAISAAELPQVQSPALGCWIYTIQQRKVIRGLVRMAKPMIIVMCCGARIIQ